MTGQAARGDGPSARIGPYRACSVRRLAPQRSTGDFRCRRGRASRIACFDIEQDYSQAELDRMSDYLNESLSGRTLLQAREWIEQQLKEDRANYDRLVHDRSRSWTLRLRRQFHACRGLRRGQPEGIATSPNLPIPTSCATCCVHSRTRPRCSICSSAASGKPD